MDSMANQMFLHSVERSFKAYLEVGTSRSTAKLKPLHGFIAQDLYIRLGEDYQIHAQGYGDDHEKVIPGRYQKKAADIAIYQNGRPLAGIAVKFVMQNYKQNSVNYFEGMLGETANVRCAGIPYFQMLILLDRLPYFSKSGGRLMHWETINQHNLDKYIVLSQDNPAQFFHSPDKTLVFIVHCQSCPELDAKEAYFDFYRQHPQLELSEFPFENFGRGVILNDYDRFITKVCHAIQAQ